MPEPVLVALRLIFLAALYLFLARVVRAVWVEIFAERRSNSEAVHSGGRSSATGSAPEAAASAHVAAKTGTRSKKREAPLTLKIVEPPERRGTTFDIGDEMTVGRADGCAVHVDDSFASQLHARIFRRDGKIFVEDLGSTNGTFLNRKPVHGPQTVEKGDRIQVGNTVLELVR